MATPSRSLADDIRGRSDAQLIDLVLARPDLARPAPADLTSLAARAGTRASVQRAVEALDRGHLQVLEAVVMAGDAADRAALLHLLGTDDVTTVDDIVEDLWRAALLWRGADGDHVVRTVPDVLGPSVAGLGAPMRELHPSAAPEHLDPERIAATIAEAPDDSRAMLERMTWGPAFGVLPTATPGRTTARWLLEHHLLVPVAADRVALPREVGLVLRDGRLHRRLELTPPPVETRSVSLVDAAAGGAASECLTHLDELAAAWGAEPPRVLRAGGLSVRDLRVTQMALDVEPEHTAFVVELAYAAGLVADDGEVVPVWAPTSEIDEWSSSEAGHRWATLALAWLASTRAPHLVGRRGTGTGPANALGPDVQWPAIRTIRREVLRELASLAVGTAPAADSLRERLAWRRPNRAAAVLDEAVEAVLREAEWLGVTGRGALSEAGRALIGRSPGSTASEQRRKVGTRPSQASSAHEPAAITRSSAHEPAGDTPAPGAPEAGVGSVDDVAAAMSAHLPSPVDHILVQADLTAVAPGPLVGGLGSFMRLAADVESRGGATVYRFTPESVRRALDAGWTAADFTETVRRSSRTPVPQPLEYLVSDVARQARPDAHRRRGGIHPLRRRGGARHDARLTRPGAAAAAPTRADGARVVGRPPRARRPVARPRLRARARGAGRQRRARRGTPPARRLPPARSRADVHPSTTPTPRRSSTGCGRPRRRPTSGAPTTIPTRPAHPGDGPRRDPVAAARRGGRPARRVDRLLRPARRDDPPPHPPAARRGRPGAGHRRVWARDVLLRAPHHRRHPRDLTPRKASRSSSGHPLSPPPSSGHRLWDDDGRQATDRGIVGPPRLASRRPAGREDWPLDG